MAYKRPHFSLRDIIIHYSMNVLLLVLLIHFDDTQSTLLSSEDAIIKFLHIQIVEILFYSYIIKLWWSSIKLNLIKYEKKSLMRVITLHIWTLKISFFPPCLYIFYIKFYNNVKRQKEKEENFHIDFIPKLSHMSYFTNLLPSIDPEMWKEKVFYRFRY